MPNNCSGEIHVSGIEEELIFWLDPVNWRKLMKKLNEDWNFKTR